MFAIFIAQVISNVCPDWVPTWLCTMIRGRVETDLSVVVFASIWVGLFFFATREARPR